MCTIAFAWQTFEAPLVAAANRDERRDRGSEPPAVRDWEPRAVAPLDREAGGTWIGYNEHGVFVAVTNRWVETDLAADRSRGLLVRDALRSESAEDAARHVERAVRDDGYDGFNLVVADSTAAVYVEWDGQLRVSNLGPGVHVVVNVGADGAYRIPSSRSDAGERQAANADAVRTALRPEPGETGDEWLDRARTVVSDHAYGVCVHGDVPATNLDGSASASEGGFGTRSSSLISLGEDERRYRYADGPPCRTEYRRVESQV